MVNVFTELPQLLLQLKLSCYRELCALVLCMHCGVDAGNVYRIRQSGLATSTPPIYGTDKGRTAEKRCWDPET